MRHQHTTTELNAVEGSVAALIDAELTGVREALQGMIDDWDRLSRYGSPMAKAANSRVAAARSAISSLTPTPPAQPRRDADNGE